MRTTRTRLLALALLTLSVGLPALGAATAPAARGGAGEPAAVRPQEHAFRDGTQHAARPAATSMPRQDPARAPLAPWWPAVPIVVSWVVVGIVTSRRPRPASVRAPAVLRLRGPPASRLLQPTA